MALRCGRLALLLAVAALAGCVTEQRCREREWAILDKCTEAWSPWLTECEKERNQERYCRAGSIKACAELAAEGK